MPTYFTGRVHSVIFENASTAFYILKMKIDQRKEEAKEGSDGFDVNDLDIFDSSDVITVRGSIPGLKIAVGVWFGFEGDWTRHEQYGRQVLITRAPMIKGEWDTSKIMKVLGAHGVGRITLQVLADKFKGELAEALSDSTKIQDALGLDKYSAEDIVSRWRAVKTMFQTLSFLSDLNIPKRKIDKVWAIFGDEAERVLAEDPWSLVQIEGFDFQQADEIANRIGLGTETPNRLKGALLYLMKHRRGMGHLYMLTGDMVSGVSEILGRVSKPQIAEALKACHKEGSIILDRKTKAGTVAIYEPWLYELESRSAELLWERLATAGFQDEKSILDYTRKLGQVGPAATAHAAANPTDIRGTGRVALHEWTAGSKLTLESAQTEAALNALTEPVSVITGLPGTGKTFCLKTVVKVLQDAEVSFLLVAPTGIAAKRVMSVTGAEASTIHRAFQAQGMDMDDDRESTYAGIVGKSDRRGNADGSAESWGYSEESPHPAEVIVVDEASMVDQHLLYRILTCTSKRCRIVFVGDHAQLPSVGPGNVLHDLISSEVCPVTRLTEIYRQEDTSDIVLAAHAINSGRVPDVGERSSDFRLIGIREESRILDTLLATVQRLYDKHANFQVLSPRHAGTLGVTNLNSTIREILNPKQPGLQEMRLGEDTIREGDRVMVVKNNYQYEIFNGDVGKIVRLDRKNKEAEIKVWGPPEIHVKLPFKEASKHLRLAYAITVHKSQGQEYDVILMPWVTGFKHQLQRNLLYTAITRARRKVCLFGHAEAVNEAVHNNEVGSRNTLFPDRLRGRGLLEAVGA